MSEDGVWTESPEELRKKSEFILSKISTLEMKAQRSARDPRRLAVPMKRGDTEERKSCEAAVLDLAGFPVVDQSPSPATLRPSEGDVSVMAPR